MAEIWVGSDENEVFSVAEGNESSWIIQGMGGDDFLAASLQNDSVSGGVGHDTIYGGEGNDFLYGDGGNDWLSGGNGSDYMQGGYGADVLYGGDSDYLETGFDSLWGGMGDDLINGAAGNDLLYGEGGADELWGRDGNDTLFGAGNSVDDGRSDTLHGGDGNDLLRGGSGGDYLFGDVGADTLYGGAGSDFLRGGDASSDVLAGGAGSDMFFMGLVYGADRILAEGNDMLGDCLAITNVHLENIEFWSEGNDLVLEMPDGSSMHIDGWSASASTQRINSFLFMLPDNVAYIWNAGLGGSIDLNTSIYVDRSVSRVISLDTGSVELIGGSLDDSLVAGVGADCLWGSLGSDTIVGGGGNDTFYYGNNGGQDVILESSNDAGCWINFYDLNLSDVSFSQRDNDLLATIDEANFLCVKNWFAPETEGKRISHAVFADGTII